MQQPSQVTPCDSMPAAVARKVTPPEEHKQVRFEEKRNKACATTSTGSCVSKRGRYVSPGRRNAHIPDTSKSADSSMETDDEKNAALLLSPKSTEKTFIATTPTTDFTVDFGSNKGFDTSNVLAWLQSPSGLFSPGFGTPSKASTPVVSTSFFFSDVANLPKGSSENNIICISPLASTKQSSVDWKEVFASPEAKVTSHPTRKGVDAVLSAEKDVMEDSDLSVLLQLASDSSTSGPAFRKEESKAPPSIPLPMKTESGNVKLSKKVSRSEEIVPPQLGMRSGFANSGRKPPFAFPAPDYYGSMRVSIGNSKGPPPSPKQPYPYPPPMYPPYYQTPYSYQAASYSQAPPPVPAQKKPKTDTDTAYVPPSATKSSRKSRGSPKKKNKSPQLKGPEERKKAASTIRDLNEAAGGKNVKAAALAAAILRGVTMRPSGKWQAQLYFAGKSRYIGVFDSREKAALAYEIAREKLKTGAAPGESTEALVNEARKAAFTGVNEQLK